MSISLLESKIYEQYLSDSEITALFSDEQEIRQLIQIEIALAKAQASISMIPDEAAAEIEQVLSSVEIDPSDLSEGVAKNGIITIPLLKSLKQHLSADVRQYLHYGATSQDIIDSASILAISEANNIIQSRLETLLKSLIEHAEQHRGVITLARTRSQQALPKPYSLKVIHWLQPLIRHFDRLFESSGRLLKVQLGGAAGTLASYGNEGTALQEAFASELGLLSEVGHHQNQRDHLFEYASILSNIIGSVSKFALDIQYMSVDSVSAIL